MHAAIYNSFHSKTLNFSPCTSFLIWSVVHTHTHTPTPTWWLRAKARPQLQKKRKTKKREWPVVTIQFMQLAIITWQTNKSDNHLNCAESYGCKVFSTIRSGFQKLIHNAVRTHLIPTKSTQMSSPAQNWSLYPHSVWSYSSLLVFYLPACHCFALQMGMAGERGKKRLYSEHVKNWSYEPFNRQFEIWPWVDSYESTSRCITSHF